MMLLEMAAGGFGDRVAVGSLDDGLTVKQIFDHSGKAAKRFRDANVENVAMIDITSPALPMCLFGASWAGLPFVPLNYRLANQELDVLLERISPSIALMQPETQERISDGSNIKTVNRDDLLASTDSEEMPTDWSMDGEDTAILLFTSGTTGEPKAAVLRQRHLVSYILGSVEFMSASEEEAALISVPPYHIAGIAATLSNLYAGRRVVQLPEFDAKKWIELVRSESITSAMVVPTMLSRIVDHLLSEGTDSEGLPTLRAISYGGGKMPQPTIEAALELLPDTNFVNAYGLTETSSTVALLGPDEHREAFASSDEEVRKRISSVGKPLPSIEVSIRDENGSELPQGEPGEIWVRGEQVSGEYKGVELTLTEDGWFPTNDGGWLDGEGYLFVTGRIDDVIVKGGQNISPGEIEEILLRHPSVSDAAAIGVPDQQWGEKIVAAVVIHTDLEVDQEELKTSVKNVLRSNRTPDEVVFLDELPYNETGKLLRRVLKEDLIKMGDGSTV